MQKTARCILCGGFLIFSAAIAFAQTSNPVQWKVSYKSTPDNRVQLTILAEIEPGWHVYSQFLGLGGPIPTRISFDKSESYSLAGTTREQGKAVRFHDDIYEMDITWFADKVEFSQDIVVNAPTAHVAGSIDYMVCNDHVCIPHKQNFNIEISAEKKSP